MKKSPIQLILKYCAPLAGVACTTALYTLIVPGIPDTTVVLTLVVVVLLCALFLGMGPGLTAAIAGTLSFNFFFITPVGSFRISDPQDIAAFLVFTIAAIIVSGLSSLVKQRAGEVMKKSSEMEKLYALSKKLMGIPDGPRGAVAIADSIVHIFGFDYCGVHVPGKNKRWKHVSLSKGYPDNVTLPDTGKLRQTSVNVLVEENDSQLKYKLLETPKGTVGILALRADGVSENTVDAIGSLVSLALRRNRVFGKQIKDDADDDSLIDG
ncbi:MAG: PAS domain-containing sensor histidine kinase [Spirochaetes bacterium]|nr:PAS domain-containing sensor histidine kinase [Spirochaetota bacterium]